jgi:hypothetical protein
MLAASLSSYSQAQESGHPKDDMKEVEVSVTGLERSKVTTIVQFVSVMIEAAKAHKVYETLYDVNVGESITMVFKFGPSVDKIDKIQGGGSTVMEGELMIVCKHAHPYLSKEVWLATKTHMETTFLNGTCSICICCKGKWIGT